MTASSNPGQQPPGAGSSGAVSESIDGMRRRAGGVALTGSFCERGGRGGLQRGVIPRVGLGKGHRMSERGLKSTEQRCPRRTFPGCCRA